MSRKYKTTGCFKFFLVLVILAPLAYIGASYYNGQDGWGNFKSLIGLDGSREEPSSDGQDDLRSEVADLNQQIKRLEKENKALSADLKACQNATN